MIVGYINGQSLEIHHSTVVEKSVDYLKADFHFMTKEWQGFRKWVHFSKGDIHYQIELKNDKVLKTDHLNLSAGEWEVYIHGSLEREVITTNKAKLVVEVTGELEGEYPEETPIPPYDNILNKIGDIESLKTRDKSNLVNAINEVLRKVNQGGGTGGNGVGIEEIEQTTTSNESSGKNVITVYLTNGDSYNFEVTNGRGVKWIDMTGQDGLPSDEEERKVSTVHMKTLYSDNTSNTFSFFVPYGKDGKSGVYVGSGEMPEDCNVQVDPTGEAVIIPTIDVDDIFEKIEGSVNLYQPTTEGWIDNITIKADGTTKENVNFCLTGKIPVKSNTTYSVNDWDKGYFFCYDSNDNFIGSSVTQLESGDIYYAYGTTKENTAYVRLNLSKETDLATTIENFNSSFIFVEGVGLEVGKYGFKAFIREIGNLSELNVEHKDNLVNAINDVFRLNTRGGVSVETSEEGNNILVFGGDNE